MGCNPDILENICPSGLRPSGLYFPIYPDYNPCIISIFLYFWGKTKRYHLSYFEYLSYNSPKLTQNYYWLWVYFGILVSNGQIRITVFNYTVLNGEGMRKNFESLEVWEQANCNSKLPNNFPMKIPKDSSLCRLPSCFP